MPLMPPDVLDSRFIVTSIVWSAAKLEKPVSLWRWTVQQPGVSLICAYIHGWVSFSSLISSQYTVPYLVNQDRLF